MQQSESNQVEQYIDALHFTTPDGKEWWYAAGEWHLVGHSTAPGESLL